MADAKLDQILATLSVLPVMQQTMTGMQQNIDKILPTLNSVVEELGPLKDQVEQHGAAIEEINRQLADMKAHSGSADGPARKRHHTDHAGSAFASGDRKTRGSTNASNDGFNDCLLKLTGMADNLSRDERLELAKTNLSALEGKVDESIEFRTYGKFGKEIYLKFANSSEADNFYKRRTHKDAAPPMHNTAGGERKRLWWNRMETIEQRKRGTQTGKASAILHKMKDDGLINDGVTHDLIVSDRKQGEIWIRRDKIAYIRLSKDLEPTLVPIKDTCDKYGVNRDTYVQRFVAPQP